MSFERPLLLLALLAATGGGADESGGGEGRSSKLVDFKQKPPYVNALEIDPADNSFLLTTNRGFYRIPEDGSRVERVKA